MVDGKTQLFADLMIWNLEWIAIAAASVFVVLLVLVLASLFIHMDLEEEPSD